jgi:hypothetical protein
MPRIEIKDLKDVIETARLVLQDSTITKIFKIRYRAAISVYILPGFRETGDTRIMGIDFIEGTSITGNWINETTLITGIDYALYDNYATVDLGYGAATNQPLYRGITIAPLTFRDNSDVYIRYKYQDPDFRPILTNFSGNSNLLRILTAILSSLQTELVVLSGSINNFTLDAVGEDLRRLITLAGIIPSEPASTTGIVRVQNTSVTTALSLSAATRFVAIRGSSYIQFKLVAGSANVGANSTANLNVIAVEPGKQSNVGPYAVTRGFFDQSLTDPFPDYILVSNPPIISGVANLFNNGADTETDNTLRRLYRTTMLAAKSSNHTVVEKAVLTTALVYDVVAFDYNRRKGVSVHHTTLSVQPFDATLLSQTSLSVIQQAALAVAPIGHRIRVEQTMNLYITINTEVFVPSTIIGNTDSTEALIVSSLSEHINSRGIGNDLLPSTLLALITSSIEVNDANFTELTFTEFVSEVPEHDGNIQLSDATGVKQNELMLQIPFNSQPAWETAAYDGINAFLDVANTPVDSRINARVNKAVLDYRNEYRPSPLNVTDFFNSVTELNSRITFNPALDVNDPVVSGEIMGYNYNFYDNIILSGIRIMLSGVVGQKVAVELRIGASPSTATLVHADTQKVITLTSETATMYTIFFTNDQTLNPADQIYWLHIRPDATNTNITSVPVNTSLYPVPFAPEAHIDGQAETTPAAPDGVFQRIFLAASYHAFTRLTGADVYKKLPVPSKSIRAESARLLEINITFKEFIDL